MIAWRYHNCDSKLSAAITAQLNELDREHINFRLWAKDANIFTGSDEASWLDWLNEPKELLESLSATRKIYDSVHHRFSSVMLLGMGGSSLSSRMFQQILAPKKDNVIVLDTIHPAAVRRAFDSVDIKKTLFIVASKSGSTLEPNLLYEYSRDQLVSAGLSDPYAHFMAITDPVTNLEQESVEHGFLPGAFGKPGIGGRYSGLSVFGIVPALFMDIDVKKLLTLAVDAMRAYGPSVRPQDHGPAQLAAFIAAQTTDTNLVFFHVPQALGSLGSWLEQLIAESLGKDGKGIVPVVVGNDPKDFSWAGTHVVIDDNKTQTTTTVPHFRVSFSDPFELSGVMFGLQMTTAFLGSIMQVNPFNQPDVESSKRQTKTIIADLALGHKLDFSMPGIETDLDTFLQTVQPGDYCAILSYLDENDETSRRLHQLQEYIEKKTATPTLIQSGPRYLHSTGQLFKGGRNNGHFIVLVGPYKNDMASSRPPLTFKDIHMSLALGDIRALRAGGRRVFFGDLLKQLRF